MQTFTFTVEGKEYTVEATDYRQARIQLEKLLETQ